MTKKNYFLVGLVFVMAGIYAIYFTEWFRPKTMHISYTNRPARNAGSGGRAPIRRAGHTSCFLT